MRILLTGASGFLGGYLLRELRQHHAVTTLGRAASNDTRCDLSLSVPVLPEVDMVVHAAGKAHVVPRTDAERKAFFDVNVKGTENLIRGLHASRRRPDTVVFFSTVAVYGLEHGLGIDEDSPARGGTPYADSKIQAEELLRAWGASTGVGVLILRIPLIAGTDAPGNLGAMTRAMRRGYYLRIGDGRARKSMVNASDLARFVPALQGLEGTYNLTDGHHPSLAELDTLIAEKLGRKVRSLPDRMADLLARLGDAVPAFPFNSYRLEKLRRELTFSDEKARRELGWSPRTVLETFKA